MNKIILVGPWTDVTKRFSGSVVVVCERQFLRQEMSNPIIVKAANIFLVDNIYRCNVRNIGAAELKEDHGGWSDRYTCKDLEDAKQMADDHLKSFGYYLLNQKHVVLT